MKYENFFKDSFESIPHYKKIVFFLFLFQNDKDFLREVGFSESDFNRLNLEFKNILMEEHEEYLEYVKDLEDSFVERFLNKQLGTFFVTILEDVRQERSPILLLNLVEPDMIKQNIFTDHENDIKKKIALENFHRQRILKDKIALDLLEKQFSV